MVNQLPTSGFESIYRPETIRLIEDTGFNTTAAELSEIGDTMDDTAVQAMSTVDSMWDITHKLVAAVKNDERAYVESSRERYAEGLLKDADERKRWLSTYSEREKLDLENQKLMDKASQEDSARIWHLAQDTSVWRTTYKLGLAQQLNAILSKEELYLALQLSSYVGAPSYKITFADGIRELRGQVGSSNFKKMCSALVEEGKDNPNRVDLKFKLIYGLKSEVGKNFKMADVILKKDLTKSDLAWVFQGDKFYQSDEAAFEAYFNTMREIAAYQESNGYLGEKANALLYWLPICGSSPRKLETLKNLLPLGHLSDYSSADNKMVAELAEDPDILEKLQLTLKYWGKGPEGRWEYAQRDLLTGLKKRSLSEGEALLTWAKTNCDEGKICGIGQDHVLRNILRQMGTISSAGLDAWAEEFKKIMAFLQDEFSSFKTNRGHSRTSPYEIEETGKWVLNCNLNANLEQVKRIIESYRDIQRTHEPDIAKEEWGIVQTWMRSSLVWNLSPSEMEAVKAAYQKLPADQCTTIISKIDLLASACKDDYRTLIQCIEILGKHKHASIEQGVSLNAIREVYGDDLEKMDQVLTILDTANEEKASKTLELLASAKRFYGNDMAKLQTTLGVVDKHYSVVVTAALRGGAFIECCEGGDIEKFDEVLTVLDAVEGEDAEKVLETLSKLAAVYGKDTHKLAIALGMLNRVVQPGAYELLRKKLYAIEGLKELYGEEVEKLGEVVDVLNKLEGWNQQLGDGLVILQDIYQGKVSTLKQVGTMLMNYHKTHPEASLSEFANQLNPFKELIQKKPDRIGIIAAYLDESSIVDEKTVAKFISIYENENREAAQAYLEDLKKKAKGMVSSQIPEGQRAMDEYGFLVRYVYPKGNYSDHERNLACGDHLGHVSGYSFDQEGYPVVLSGLLGYGLKEGEKENPVLLEAYCKRLDKMRAFVSSRGPDNKALQEAYDVKIEAIFQQKAELSFKEIKALGAKEKLFCLIVSEALRKAKELGLSGGRVRTEQDKVFVPDEEIMDLVVEYKYAYHEDLEAYVQRSADDAKQYGDSVSQNYILWSELSVIYGENMKHVMRNDILEKIADEPHFARIVDSYVKTIGELATDDDLLGKARERIQSTLDNTRIPAEKRPEVLWKQIWTMFSSNLKFANAEQSKIFETKLREAGAHFLAEPTIENFEAAYPKLVAARNERRFDIAAKVEDLLSRDIGLIFKEVAKYEELAEVEEKERSMNGPKDKLVKKSSKKRNIRGHLTKTQESANARMGAYLCIAGDGEMYKNPNYFELVLEDEETNRCVGLVMLLNIAAVDGKKYLWFGPNPFESFLTQVSAKKTYDYMYKRVCAFAKENGFDGVVVPSNENQILGACTNRGGEFPGFIKASRVKDEKGNIKVVKFGAKHTLGGSYGYEDGALIWEREKEPALAA